MTRPLRIQYAGAWYHVMNRGRREETVFSTKDDYIAFVEVLKEAVSLWNINITAYCLMPNHYHILLRTPEGNLSRSMRHINGVFTQRYNRRHRQDGQLFRGRYKSILVDKDNYLCCLVGYIHRNPLRAGLVVRLNDYPWSSHKGYISESNKWKWLSKEPFYKLLTPIKSARLKEYKEFIRDEESKDIIDFFSRKNRPSMLGSEKFINWVKDNFNDLRFREEIPETKELIPSMEKLKLSVSKAYKVNPTSLCGIKRGVSNEPKNVAIFLARRLRRDSLKVIGKEFNISNYSSVSTIIERMKTNLGRNKKLKRHVDKIITEII